MDLNHYPNIWPDLLPVLEAALQKHEEATAKMADFRKKYTSVKNKAKRVEKYLVTMDEEMRKYHELYMLDCLRLAENKFALIDKKLKRFKQHEQLYCNQSLKLLKGSRAMEPNTTHWHIQRISTYLYRSNELIRDVSDMLRIAKGHLDKVDHIKKYWAQIRKRRRPS
ncbi:MAG: hypothetical protein GC178_05455 [Flavobacteriales bacterium]|nr:hypothetical protein [Flavobacteriales bacterium]